MRNSEINKISLNNLELPFGDMALNSSGKLSRMWEYTPGRRPLWIKKKHLLYTVRHAVKFPHHVILKAVKPTAQKWAVYFIFAPGGAVTAHHEFTIDTLNNQGFAILLIICGVSAVEAEARFSSRSDALIWKEVTGFDFSAYTIGLRHIAKYAPGSDAIFLNDSVFGPFTDLQTFIARAPWRLTGFTASAYWGNHIQSYAFILKNINARLARNMWLVFNPFWAFDAFEDVVICQELQMAQLASKYMSVGAFWYRDMHTAVLFAEELNNDGFPFIKKSLFGKNAHWHPDGLGSTLLERHHYPHNPRP